MKVGRCMELTWLLIMYIYYSGVVMVGPAFAVDANYFKKIGTYDDGMEIWGGENLELAWRVSNLNV